MKGARAGAGPLGATLDRLFTEDRFPILDRPQDQFGVGLGGAGDDDCVDIGIIENGLGLRWRGANCVRQVRRRRANGVDDVL